MDHANKPTYIDNLGYHMSSCCSVLTIQKYQKDVRKQDQNVFLNFVPGVKTRSVLLGICKYSEKSADSHHLHPLSQHEDIVLHDSFNSNISNPTKPKTIQK